MSEDIIQWMRANGVLRVEFDWTIPQAHQCCGFPLRSIELLPQSPPVTDDLSLPEDEETKPPGICVHPKCGEKNGWQFARDYCRTHGLAAAGVSGAR